MKNTEAMTKRGRKPGTARQARRLHEIVQLLRARRAPARLTDLAVDTAVSIRQTQRDLDALARLGHELVRDRDDDGFSTVSLAKSRIPDPLPTGALSKLEFVALAIDVTRISLRDGGSPWSADLASAYEKLSNIYCEVPVEASRCAMAGPEDAAVEADVYDAFIDAICHSCELIATARDETAPAVRVSPCAIIVSPSSISALCRRADRTFHIVSLGAFIDADPIRTTRRPRPTRAAIAGAMRILDAG